MGNERELAIKIFQNILAPFATELPSLRELITASPFEFDSLVKERRWQIFTVEPAIQRICAYLATYRAELRPEPTAGDVEAARELAVRIIEKYGPAYWNDATVPKRCPEAEAALSAARRDEREKLGVLDEEDEAELASNLDEFLSEYGFNKGSTVDSAAEYERVYSVVRNWAATVTALAAARGNRAELEDELKKWHEIGRRAKRNLDAPFTAENPVQILIDAAALAALVKAEEVESGE